MGTKGYFTAFVQALVVFLLFYGHVTSALSFPSLTSIQSTSVQSKGPEFSDSAAHVIPAEPADVVLRNHYNEAFTGLAALKTKGPCYQTACRLLGSICSPSSTEYSHKIGDFVDAFAASLAICDLQRGDFDLPDACEYFQEASLSKLLHSGANPKDVMSEIGPCLRGLSNSGPLWHTFIAYKPQVLHICEAMGEDYNRVQTIALNQAIVKFMGNIATTLPHWEKMLDVITIRFGELQQSINDQDEAVRQWKKREVERQAERDAAHQQALRALNESMAVFIDDALSRFEKKISSQLFAALNEKLGTVDADLHGIHENIQRSIQASILGTEVSEAASRDYADLRNAIGHDSKLFSEDGFLTTWGPYLLCPMVSLGMGSYGLPPSLIRNIGLMALGEAAAFVISSSNPTITYLRSVPQWNENGFNSTNMSF